MNRVFAHMAASLAHMSTCPKLQVGALIAKDDVIISTGSNGALDNNRTCHAEGCGTVDKPTHVHAEVHAITKAALKGVDLYGADIYITHVPCHRCSQCIIASGIKRVFYKDSYKDYSTDMLREHGVKTERHG